MLIYILCHRYLTLATRGVLKSLGEVGAVMTNIVLGTTDIGKALSISIPKHTGQLSNSGAADLLVMDTKLKIIEILQVRGFLDLFSSSYQPDNLSVFLVDIFHL